MVDRLSGKLRGGLSTLYFPALNRRCVRLGIFEARVEGCHLSVVVLALNKGKDEVLTLEESLVMNLEGWNVMAVQDAAYAVLGSRTKAAWCERWNGQI